jgi:hypothetical protein
MKMHGFLSEADIILQHCRKWCRPRIYGKIIRNKHFRYSIATLYTSLIALFVVKKFCV